MKTCSDCDACAFSWHYNEWMYDENENDDERAILHIDIYTEINKDCPLNKEIQK